MHLKPIRSNAVHSYAKQTSELERTVARMLFESYGVPQEHYDSHDGSITYMLRLMKYRAPDPEETDVGCDVHTDKSFLTILHQNEVNGLEVKTKGGDWLGYESSPSSFIVIAGDALMVTHSRPLDLTYPLLSSKKIKCQR